MAVRPQTAAAFRVVRAVELTLTPPIHRLDHGKRAREISEDKEPEVPENPTVVEVVVVLAQLDPL